MSGGRTSSITLLKAFRLASTSSYRGSVRNAGPQFKRSYFSKFHPDPPPYPETQDRILSAALNRVPEYGFSTEALVQGAKDAGYLEVSVQLFPRGAFDLVKYHLVTQRLALNEKVQFPEGATLGLGAKVRALTMARLRANADIIHQWQGVGFSDSFPFRRVLANNWPCRR